MKRLRGAVVRAEATLAWKYMVLDSAISGWEPCIQVGLTGMHKGDPAQAISPFGGSAVLVLMPSHLSLCRAVRVSVLAEAEIAELHDGQVSLVKHQHLSSGHEGGRLTSVATLRSAMSPPLPHVCQFDVPVPLALAVAEGQCQDELLEDESAEVLAQPPTHGPQIDGQVHAVNELHYDAQVLGGQEHLAAKCGESVKPCPGTWGSGKPEWVWNERSGASVIKVWGKCETVSLQ